MRICFITKYPPIQGGVSMHCYWAARGLAARGHQVFVVTNADEVEETFRIRISDRDRLPDGEYAPQFANGGSVTVISSQPQDRRRMYYIPMGNPVVTKLAAAATDVIRREHCDVIFAYYLEPFGVAANLASAWTGVHYVFKHAGSDLHRLMDLPELHTAYREVLAGAARIISRGPSRQKLLENGLPAAKMTAEVAFGVPLSHFHPGATPLSNEDLNDLAGQDLCFPSGTPLLGVYGKLGEYKGSWDLLHALARLRDRGLAVQLLALSHGWQERRFTDLAAELGVSDQVHLLPFLPSWRVPSFIRRCSAIAFLERQFPISAHTPTIPSEVICCGAPLLLSAEVARKQRFRSAIRDGRNLVIAPDPTDHGSLADRIEYLLADPERTTRIGVAGLAELGTGTPHEAYLDGLETLLRAVASKEPAAATAARPLDSRSDVMDSVRRFFPYTAELISGRDEQVLRDTVAGRSLGSGLDRPRDLALAVGEHLSSVLTRPGASADAAATARYELARIRWGQGRSSATGAGTSATDAGPMTLVPSRTVGISEGLVPRLSGDFELVDLDRDVESLMAALDAGENPDPARDTGVQMTVLFHESAPALRLNPVTRALIDVLAEEPRDVAGLIDVMSARLGPGVQRDDVRTGVCDVVEALFWEGLVTLREPQLEGEPRLEGAAT